MSQTTSRLALVTGAAGTMGQAFTRQLVADGHRVVAVDLRAEAMAGLAEEMPGAVIPLALDISDAEAVAAACAEIRRDHGPVQILVNNAGVLSTNKAVETTPEEWRRIMGVNIDGAFYLAQQVLPGMRELRWGRIVNICSMSMKTGGLTSGTAYSTSKGAMGVLTFSLAREAAAQGITVNGIAPGYVMTPMVSEQLTEEQRTRILAGIPVGEFCTGEEVAHLVSYLVGHNARHITGEIIDINGGIHMD